MADWLQTYVSGTLQTWAYRTKFTIDGSKVDGDLTDFPVLVHLSDSSGYNGRDVSNIFDYLANYSMTTTSGLTNEYTVDSVDGSTLYDTAGSNNGSISGMTIIDGIVGNALSGGGSSSKVTFSSSISGYQSISFWMKRNNSSTDNMFSDSGTSNLIAHETYLYTYAGGQNVSNLSASVGEWHHVVCVMESSSALRFYLDKVKASGTVYWPSPAIKYIGRGSPYGGQYVPQMDQIRFYNRQLTEAEIEVLYNEGFTPPNEKKIAITGSDGTTQQYIEIEDWSLKNQEAWLWTKVPTISSGISQDLYLYYDVNKPDNTSYVGYVGSVTAANVWNANFKAVYHMNQDPSGSSPQILDSTGNNNDGSSGGSMTSGDLVAAKIGNGLEFDGSDDYVDTGVVLTDDTTFDVWVKASSYGSRQAILSNAEGANNGTYFEFVDGDTFRMITYDGDISGATYNSPTTFSTDVWYNIVATVKDNGDGTGDYKIYFNKELVASGIGQDYDPGATADNYLYLAANHSYNSGSANTFYGGLIDEVRMSNSVRTQEWINTSYESSIDNLINYGLTTRGLYYFSGTVEEFSSPAQRIVRAYRADTGELMDETTSTVSGTFLLNTTYSGAHYLICLDEAGGYEFNDLIYGQVMPALTTVS